MVTKELKKLAAATFSGNEAAIDKYYDACYEMAMELGDVCTDEVMEANVRAYLYEKEKENVS